jgi:hypothetical protein
MAQYDQNDITNALDDVTKKMESYFLTTQDEMRLLRNEIAELTRLLKAQRAGDMVIKKIGAPSVGDLTSFKNLLD